MLGTSDRGWVGPSFSRPTPEVCAWGMTCARMGDEGKAVGSVPPTALLFVGRARRTSGQDTVVLLISRADASRRAKEERLGLTLLNHQISTIKPELRRRRQQTK